MDISKVYSSIANDFSRTRFAMWPCMESFYKTHFKAESYILDVGCGSGHILKLLKINGADVTGI